MKQVPPYIAVSIIASACGMSRKATIGMLRRAGILDRRGRLYVVARSLLRERLPDAAEDVYAYLVLQSPSEPPRAHP